jgi:hypothetical protein
MQYQAQPQIIAVDRPFQVDLFDEAVESDVMLLGLL